MSALLRKAVALWFGASLVFAPVGAALASAPAGGAVSTDTDHHDGHASKIRAADEDAHWWIGQEVLPVELRQKVADLIGPSWIEGTPPEKIGVSHIFFAALVFLIGIGMALAARRKIRDDSLPPRKWSFAAFFDVLMEMLVGLMESMMTREQALRYLPLMTAVFVFILISNMLGLIPGLVPPTQSLNLTAALGGFAFLYYNWQGLKTHGLAYLKHFMGPLWWLAPLMLPIEIISHMVRPASLAIRLMGNMFGDHQVLFNFVAFGLPLVPLPVMALGLIVMVVQALVFTLLFMVYIALAIEDHGHDDHAPAHGEHAHAH